MTICIAFFYVIKTKCYKKKQIILKGYDNEKNSDDFAVFFS